MANGALTKKYATSFSIIVPHRRKGVWDSADGCPRCKHDRVSIDGLSFSGNGEDNACAQFNWFDVVIAGQPVEIWAYFNPEKRMFLRKRFHVTCSKCHFEWDDT